MKKIPRGKVGGGEGTGGGGYQLRNIVGHHSWPTKKTFHFKPPKRAKKTWYLQEAVKPNFHHKLELIKELFSQFLKSSGF